LEWRNDEIMRAGIQLSDILVFTFQLNGDPMLHEVPLPQAYRVTPTGLYLISTAWEDKRNVQFAFRALGISDDPPLLIIAIQDKNFSREMIQKSREFVLNVCSRDQLHAVDRSRDLSGRNVEDKFQALGLETLPAKYVEAPLVAGCHANVECRVVNEFAVEGLFLFVGRALASHVDDEVAPVARLAGKTFRLDGPI
jgi:flavin reductase (DIM6/NTAB) family NADH-FMN oxidoreductase RutF